MTATDPAQQVFWLASRALGIVAIVLLSLSVSLGLAMSGRLMRRPGLPAKLKRFHEASTLVTLALIAGHAGVLLLDGYLRPGLAGIMLPFALGYRPFWTGIGVIAGWLAVILAASFYVRRWIGVKTWRWLHRWTLAVYILALAHVVGAGTDGRSPWMLALLTVLVAPNVFALAYRMLPAAPRAPQQASRPAGQQQRTDRADRSLRASPRRAHPCDDPGALRMTSTGRAREPESVISAALPVTTGPRDHTATRAAARGD